MAQHITKIQTFLQTEGLDAILFKSKTMKRYLNTVTGGGCQVLIFPEAAYLILEGRYLVEAQEKELDLTLVLHEPYKTGKSYVTVVDQLLKKHQALSIGVEEREVRVLEYRQMCALGWQVRLLTKEIPQLRMQKEPKEILMMQEAVNLTDEIYNRVLKKLHLGMAEYEISALLQYYALQAGATKMSFDTIVGTGYRSALPHGRPTNRQIKAHEPILIDFGIEYQGYQSDMTRVCFIGEPQEQIAEIYQIVLQAQLAGIQAMKPGVMAKTVDQAAREIITKAGYGQYFVHGLGHGLGVGNDDEFPLINAHSEMLLMDGMMMSCEPGIYLPGIAGIRIEDDIVIIDGQACVMNHTPKELLILESEGEL